MQIKRIVFTCCLSLLSLGLFAQEASELAQPMIETTTEETQKENVEVTPHLTVYQTISANSLDLESSSSDIDWYEDPVYTRTNVKASLDVKVGQFTFTPYVQERLETFWDYHDTPVAGEAFEELSPVLRNRFYLGSTFAYNIPDIIKIAVSADFRITSKLSESETPNHAQQYRFAPIVKLSGKYDFGFSWGVEHHFSMEFNKSTIGTAEPLNLMYYEGFLDLSYEFLQHVKGAEGQKAYLFLDYNYKLDDYLGIKEYAEKKFDSFGVLGVKYSQKGVSPSLGLYVWNEVTDKESSFKNIVGTGFQAGVTWKIKDFEFKCSYVGGQRVYDNTDPLTGEWESQVYTRIKYSL